MPDIILSLFRCLRRFLRDAEPRTRRSKAQETALAIDHPEIAAAEAYDMAAGVVFAEADTLARECLADEDIIAAPSDLTGGTHSADLVIGVVPGVLETARQSARRRLPALDGRLLVERFVRPLLVEVAAEGIETTLLLGRRFRRRLRGLGLQRTVHALMSAVILRARRPDACLCKPKPRWGIRAAVKPLDRDSTVSTTRCSRLSS